MNRICANVNEICGGSLRTNWTTDDIVDESTWHAICDRAAALGRYPITYDTDYININNIERSLFDQYDETHHITATAKLTGLSISNGTLSPAFSPTTYSYTANVSSPSSVVTATTDYSAIAYIVNGAVVDPHNIEWVYGYNTLQVTATLNGTMATYSVRVYCTYRHASLNSLSIGGVAIPISEYMTFQVSASTSQIAFSYTGSSISIKLNGTSISASSGTRVTWLENSNTLEITVSASDVKVYTVAVDCLYEYPIPARIATISISDSMMIPSFDSEITSYIVIPEELLSTVDVIPEEDVTFKVYFNNDEIENGSEVGWSESGGDVVKVVTDAGNGFTSVTYTVTSRTEIATSALAPMRSGSEIFSGDDLPGEAVG